MAEPEQQKSLGPLERLLEDLDHAAAVADDLAAEGRLLEAIKTFFAIMRRDPHRAVARHRYVALSFAAFQAQLPLGSLERGRKLLYLLSVDSTVPEVEAAYFENLELLLSQQPRPAEPGRLVLGLGCGRCGSTTLSVLFAGAEGTCATHENPVVLTWPPRPEQIAFHERRFARLLDAVPLVFDAAHWWLNAGEAMIAHFPDTKLIGLIREREACAGSFLAVKGLGRDSKNHWVEHDGSFWQKALWDEVYPSYEVSLPREDVPDAAKLEQLQRSLVQRYVDEYNTALCRLDARVGARMLLVPTERLSERGIQDDIQDFVGLRLPYLAQVINQGSINEGMNDSLRF